MIAWNRATCANIILVALTQKSTRTNLSKQPATQRPAATAHLVLQHFRHVGRNGACGRRERLVGRGHRACQHTKGKKQREKKRTQYRGSVSSALHATSRPHQSCIFLIPHALLALSMAAGRALRSAERSDSGLNTLRSASRRLSNSEYGAFSPSSHIQSSVCIASSGWSRRETSAHTRETMKVGTNQNRRRSKAAARGIAKTTHATRQLVPSSPSTPFPHLAQQAAHGLALLLGRHELHVRRRQRLARREQEALERVARRRQALALRLGLLQAGETAREKISRPGRRRHTGKKDV